jgi:hypothetical protein
MKVSGLREYSELSVRQVIQVIFEATIHHFVRRNNARLVVSQRLPRSHFPGRSSTADSRDKLEASRAHSEMDERELPQGGKLLCAGPLPSQ